MQLNKLDLSLGFELVPLKSDDVAPINRGVADIDSIRLSGEEASALVTAYGKQLESAPSCDYMDAHCSLYDLRMFTHTIIANDAMPDLARSLLTSLNRWRYLGIDVVAVYGQPSAMKHPNAAATATAVHQI